MEFSIIGVADVKANVVLIVRTTMTTMFVTDVMTLGATLLYS